jgi:gamma-glutamyltranspeptidase/glutathione hydrolase
MSSFTTRPVLLGTHGMVTAGHYLAASAGFRQLVEGGNAVDAAVAAGLALNVLEPQSNGIGGEVPILIHHAKSGRTVAISGQGTAPEAASIGWFREQGIDIIPGDGLLPATVPASFGAWTTALEHFGTRRFVDVMAPALELARDGFGVYPNLRASIEGVAARFRDEWPSSAAVFLPGGRVPEVGERLAMEEWAETFGRVVAESEKTRDRIEGIRRARGVFYRGFVSERIGEFCRTAKVRDVTGRESSGFLTAEDLADYETRIEAPVSIDYKGLVVHKCPPWCQGPVFLQHLRLLEGYDLPSLGHNTADYLHVYLETTKLAFADREQYYGDPAFVEVPLERLLSREYAARRRELVDMARASLELLPGDAEPISLVEAAERGNWGHDTTHCDAVDAEGNMMAATPSGGWFSASPVVPGLGFPLGTRGQMFSVNPEHPNALMPGKRPRTTLTPSLVLKDGAPHMVFGTPGGDRQDQWTLQFFLNVVEFGMDLQEAIDAPNVYSRHFPQSFYPRDAHPGGVVVEARLSEGVRAELEARGHRVAIHGAWSGGRVLAIRREPDGVIAAAASPRSQMAYAAGW